MSLLQTIVSLTLLLAGASLLLIAGIGVVRMPDLFLRMSASSKASSLGAACILLAVAVSSAELGIVVRALAGVVFLLLTTPVAAHMIGRAAYIIGVPLWKHTVCDELHGQYDRRTHALAGSPGDELTFEQAESHGVAQAGNRAR